MHVLVTGGNGFIGRWTVRELLARGHQVLVFDRHRDRPPETGATLMLGDINNPVAVNEAMAHVDSWIHLAGVLGTQETIDDPIPAAATNVFGGLCVLQAAARYGLPGVNIGVGNWFENNTYSLTKNCVERFCDMYRRYRNLDVTTVRALNAYGPGQSVCRPYGNSKVRKIGPSFIFRAYHGAPIEIYGDGQQIMDMVWAGDVARVLAAALEYTADNGGSPVVFEAGTGRRTTVLEIAQAVIAAVGSGTIQHLPMRPGETPGVTVCADTTTLAPLAEYGVDPAKFRTLEDGLVDTVAAYFPGR